MTKVAIKGRYLVSLMLAAVLAAGLLMLVQPAQAQSEDEKVGPATHLDEDMVIDKRAPSKVKVGQTITYTLYVAQLCDDCTDEGQNSSDDVTVTDVLPSGVRFLGVTTDLYNPSGNSDEFTCTGGSTVTCESDDLWNGDLARITITAKAKTRGTKVNTASVALSNEADDTNASNNTDTASTRVVKRK